MLTISYFYVNIIYKMRNEELDMKKIDHFVIRTYLEDGEIWETIRHTREGLTACIESICQTEGVVKFTVEEKVAA